MVKMTEQVKDDDDDNDDDDYDDDDNYYDDNDEANSYNNQKDRIEVKKEKELLKITIEMYKR